MPLDIETELFNGLFVCQIMHLLEDHQPDHGIELLGRAAIPIVVMFAESVHGKLREDFFLEKTGP